ncbi:MAG: protein-disulfide reductase DsbD [Candidatus Brocadiaceae bacterium]
MKTRFLRRYLFVTVFLVFSLSLTTYGDVTPFKLSANLQKERVSAGGVVAVTITIAIEPNHHIYKDQISVESADTALFTLSSVSLPPAKRKYDQFLEKEVELYEETVEIKAFLLAQHNIPPGSNTIKLRVQYQGCSDKFCFAPRTEELALPVQIESARLDLPTSQGDGKLSSPVPAPHKTEAGSFQKTVESRGIFISLIIVFWLGVGLSFTPCVYPMIPITVAVIGGKAGGDQQAARKPLHAFFLSMVYVLGIAIVYSTLGVIAASTGGLFGAALQNPWVIGFVIAVFLGLALSMFGVYTLQVPSFISDRLGAQTRSGIIGVFLMGLVSGIVASPCIGPALAGVLVYIASTGNKLLGFWMLFVFAWGLGVILIVLGTFSGAIKALPKSGTWMVTVERIFGIILLGAALYYARFVISPDVFIIILGIFLIVTSVFSGGFDRLTHESATFLRAKKAFGIIVFIFGTYFLAGHLLIKGFILPPLSHTTQNQAVTAKEKMDWVLSEEDGLRQAKAGGKIAMIDFWAEWCAACMEFEKITYINPDVVKESRRFVNIKIDCTRSNDPQIKQLLNKYSVVGLPTIIFINKDGTVIKDKTITGFVNPDEFLRMVKSLE